MSERTCSVPEFTKTPRSTDADLCGMHYFRLRRTGRLDVQHPQRDRRGICTVDGCGEVDHGPHGLCAKHWTRRRRHGDPTVVLSPTVHPGPEHPFWVGDDVGYGGMHDRVRKARGSASRHNCVDCGNQAKHWSYDHSDPAERVSSTGTSAGAAYSTSIDHYEPRCVPCHKRFDLTRATVS